EDAKQCRLARAVRAEQRHAFPDAERERHVVEDAGGTIGLAEVQGLNHKIGGGKWGRGPAPRVLSRCDQSLIALRRAMRSSMGGCVENSVARPPDVSGLTMKRCAVAGVASSCFCRVAISSFASACSSPEAWPHRCAPEASAWYSREREMAIWMSMAAKGARMAMRSAPMALPPPPPSSSLRRPPPKMAANCAIS